jgi:hypothetical protein
VHCGVLCAFEKIIAAFKLREKTPRVAEDIPEFKM